MHFPVHISINCNTKKLYRIFLNNASIIREIIFLVLYNIITSLMLSLLNTIKFVLFKLIVSLLIESHISRYFKVLFISVSSSTYTVNRTSEHISF